MATEREVAGMRKALELADHGRGLTSPNPSVGAVVLDPAGEIIAEGTTEAPGGRHAEVVALEAAGARAAGATMISTLEPCSHVGRTGPCAVAIIDAAIARVVFAHRDPHPTAAGGAALMRAKGIDVEEGVLEDEAAESMHPWLTSLRLGRPHVTWKSAHSLDARIAAGDGSPAWVSSEEARLDAHRRLRAKADAIVVGSATIHADDPALTVRTGHAGLDARSPLRVVLDRQSSVPATARALDSAGDNLLTAGAPREVLDELRDRGVVDVLIEGGPTVGSAFFREGLVDRLVLYVAPKLLGTSGPPAMSPSLEQLELLDATPVGPDLRLTYSVAR